jgi:RHS repeat-associated protein
LVSRTDYTAFGEVRAESGTSPTDYQYTGQRSYLDSFGLHYYVARWYDPVTAHFAQADSIIPQPGNSADWNRYAYVLYNPMRYIDPSGHEYLFPPSQPLPQIEGDDPITRQANRDAQTFRNSYIAKSSNATHVVQGNSSLGFNDWPPLPSLTGESPGISFFGPYSVFGYKFEGSFSLLNTYSPPNFTSFIDFKLSHGAIRIGVTTFSPNSWSMPIYTAGWGISTSTLRAGIDFEKQSFSISSRQSFLAGVGIGQGSFTNAITLDISRDPTHRDGRNVSVPIVPLVIFSYSTTSATTSILRSGGGWMLRDLDRPGPIFNQ